MVGGHIDSWHIGTGATDNAVGVAVAMEAVRILKAANLKPRRTIRIGLWGGEEQAFLGSRAYVSKYLGYYTNAPQSVKRSQNAKVTSPKDNVDKTKANRNARSRSSSPGAGSERTLIRKPDYNRFSAYFNLDNGAGKIRGIYLQNNEAARPLFQKWFTPFQDLGASTLSLSNTGGTDHIPFDSIGLPGFQFIQDDLEYWSRCHHANMDVYDRIIPDDIKQASVIMASIIYNAAMADEKIPRKSAVGSSAVR
jgi:Zn-dependent M28 family amino/carboxypeptidase